MGLACTMRPCSSTNSTAAGAASNMACKSSEANKAIGCTRWLKPALNSPSIHIILGRHSSSRPISFILFKKAWLIKNWLSDKTVLWESVTAANSTPARCAASVEYSCIASTISLKQLLKRAGGSALIPSICSKWLPHCSAKSASSNVLMGNICSSGIFLFITCVCLKIEVMMEWRRAGGQIF